MTIAATFLAFGDAECCTKTQEELQALGCVAREIVWITRKREEGDQQCQEQQLLTGGMRGWHTSHMPTPMQPWWGTVWRSPTRSRSWTASKFTTSFRSIRKGSPTKLVRVAVFSPLHPKIISLSSSSSSSRLLVCGRWLMSLVPVTHLLVLGLGPTSSCFMLCILERWKVVSQVMFGAFSSSGYELDISLSMTCRWSGITDSESYSMLIFLTPWFCVPFFLWPILEDRVVILLESQVFLDGISSHPDVVP